MIFFLTLTMLEFPRATFFPPFFLERLSELSFQVQSLYCIYRSRRIRRQPFCVWLEIFRVLRVYFFLFLYKSFLFSIYKNCFPGKSPECSLTIYVIFVFFSVLYVAFSLSLFWVRIRECKGKNISNIFFRWQNVLKHMHLNVHLCR